MSVNPVGESGSYESVHLPYPDSVAKLLLGLPRAAIHERTTIHDD